MSSDATDREIIEYIELFGSTAYEKARIVRVEKHDTETGKKENHIGIEVKLEDGRWFYKQGIGRCVGPDIEQSGGETDV